MKKIWVLFFLFVAETVHAGQFLKVLKNNSVASYKEPTTQSKMLNVFAQGDVVESVAEEDGWYKIKVPFNQGFYLIGWTIKNNPNLQLQDQASTSSASPSSSFSSVQGSSNTSDSEGEAEPNVQKRSTGLDRSVESDLNRGTAGNTHFVRAFAGPVFSLYKYGAFQYKAGVSYEVPISRAFRVGFPISYSMGGNFSSLMGGLEGVYSFYMGGIAISPRIGAGYEYLYGNGKSFQALSGEAGFIVEFSISDHLILGVEPFTAQAMTWNTTDSLNKVPFNIRGESLILLRGRW